MELVFGDFIKNIFWMGERNDIFDRRWGKFTKENFYGGENK